MYSPIYDTLIDFGPSRDKGRTNILFYRTLRRYDWSYNGLSEVCYN